MIHVLSYTEAGGHPVNEDAFLARPHPADPECWLVFLADGQGGRAGGARTARLACETAAALASRVPPADLVESSRWQEILSRTDAAVSADEDAGCTTLIGLCVRSGQLAGASCGDSAAIAASRDTLSDLTSRQFKNPPVGSGEADFIPFEMDLVRPWRVLVMSDGVWKYAGWDKINNSFAKLDGQELLAAIQNRARLRTSRTFPDDFTLVLLESKQDYSAPASGNFQ
jgi:serine/threonine protein phosphatase PrpC